MCPLSVPFCESCSVPLCLVLDAGLRRGRCWRCHPTPAVLGKDKPRDARLRPRQQPERSEGRTRVEMELPFRKSDAYKVRIERPGFMARGTKKSLSLVATNTGSTGNPAARARARNSQVIWSPHYVAVLATLLGENFDPGVVGLL